MEKLKFEFVVKSGEDPKTNVLCVTTIMDADKNMFLIPEQFQPVKLHTELIKTTTYQTVKATLQRRHEKRQVWFSLTPELRHTYVDEEGNMQFKGYLLEENTSKTQQVLTNEMSTETLTKILESIAESRQSNFKKVSEKFVIEKFTNKTSSVTQWMDNFETECNRLGINNSIQKIQVFRLFLEDSCQDWYKSMLIKYTINSEWGNWKKSFCETYVDKGWSPIRYAFLFKYRQGTLLDYTVKKERLLLEVNKLLDKQTLIDLIVIGLPNFIADEIDRNTLKETEDLFSNIRSLEHLMNKKIVGKKIIDLESKTKEKNFKLQPCRICEKVKKGTRYHSESVC